MKRAIFMSVQPKRLKEILNGKKTIEVRKTKPDCELPIDVYLFCTKEKPYFEIFINRYCNVVNGKIVGKFTLKEVEDLRKYEWSHKDGHFYDLLKGACLTTQDLQDYCPNKNGESKPLFAWHISDLVIFDKPKELREFYKRTSLGDEDFKQLYYDDTPEKETLHEIYLKVITKAPQSWQYVWVKEE